MKKTILSILSLFPIIGFSQYGLMVPPSAEIPKEKISPAKKNFDSLFIENRYVGLIDTGSVVMSSYGNAEGNNFQQKEITFKVILDDFTSKEERESIEKTYTQNPNDKIKFIFTERFASRTKIEIAGFYTKKAGELMNSRNNWRIGGAAVVTAIFLISPPSLAVYSIAAVIGGVSSIVSICKDYKANSMLKKAGDVMMSK